MYTRTSVAIATIPFESSQLSLLSQARNIFRIHQKLHVSQYPNHHYRNYSAAHENAYPGSENDYRDFKSGETTTGAATESRDNASEKTFLAAKGKSVSQPETAKKAMGSRPERTSTITKAEKATFSRMFTDLVMSTRDPEDSELPDPQGERSAASHEIGEIRTLSKNVASIYESAITDHENKKTQLPRHRGTFDDRLLARLPVELREAAKKADRFYSKYKKVPIRRVYDWHDQHTQFVKLDVNEKNTLFTRRYGKERTITLRTLVEDIVKKKLKETAYHFDSVLRWPDGDLKIWQFCEKRIFPLPQLVPSPQGYPTTMKGSKSSSSPSTRPRDFDLPNFVTPLALISRLYPRSISLVVSLLAQHYPTSLILPSILPHIKSLGPISHVLGASTELYNELLRVRWRVYSDLSGMNDLLVDMQNSGVGFNEETLRIIKDVEISREREQGGVGIRSRYDSRKLMSKAAVDNDERPYEERARSEIWWDLSATCYWFERITHYWYRAVQESIIEAPREAIAEEADDADE